MYLEKDLGSRKAFLILLFNNKNYFKIVNDLILVENIGQISVMIKLEYPKSKNIKNIVFLQK